MPDVAMPRPHPVGMLIDVEIGQYSLAAATAFGPRLVSLRFRKGPELFAQLGDDVVIEHPDSGIYRFRGGHRLWAAPEVPSVTYASDDHPCVVTARAGGLTIRGPVDDAGFIKELNVSLEGKRLIVDHRLANTKLQPTTVAVWALTQLRLGGVALIPIRGPSSRYEFQADRSLLLWPYTSLIDGRLSWQERAAVIDAVPGPRIKIGSGPSPGRLGYLIDQQLFTKEIAPAGHSAYPDRGAVAQVFVEDSFCELESVGPIVSLEPGSSVSHREVWEVTECTDLAAAYSRVVDEVEV
jgi:hypothetical protein